MYARSHPISVQWSSNLDPEAGSIVLNCHRHAQDKCGFGLINRSHMGLIFSYFFVGARRRLARRFIGMESMITIISLIDEWLKQPESVKSSLMSVSISSVQAS